MAPPWGVEHHGLIDAAARYDGYRDQLVVRHGKETEIYWAEGNGAPELVYGGEREKVR